MLKFKIFNVFFFLLVIYFSFVWNVLFFFIFIVKVIILFRCKSCVFFLVKYGEIESLFVIIILIWGIFGWFCFWNILCMCFNVLWVLVLLFDMEMLLMRNLSKGKLLICLSLIIFLMNVENLMMFIWILIGDRLNLLMMFDVNFFILLKFMWVILFELFSINIMFIGCVYSFLWMFIMKKNFKII